MREKSKFEQALAIIEAGRKADDRWQNHCHDMQIHTAWHGDNAYAEPGYEAEVVVLGNFNSYGGEWDEQARRRIGELDYPKRVGDLLEKAGIEIEWSDEWEACDSCGRLFRTSPTHYGWTMYGFIDDGFCECGDCVKEDPDAYLEYLREDHRRANTILDDLEDHGYRKLDMRFENGLYGGQCDDPEKIRQSLDDLGIRDVIFQIEDVGQFDCKFSVYVNGDDLTDWFADSGFDDGDPAECLAALLVKAGTTGQDPAKLMQQALQSIKPLPGDGIDYHKVNADGSVDSRKVSPQEFIDGIR